MICNIKFAISAISAMFVADFLPVSIYSSNLDIKFCNFCNTELQYLQNLQ